MSYALSFVDINENNYVNISIKKNYDNCQNITEGINIYGTCHMTKCISFKKEIILPLKNVYKLDLVQNREELVCPKCNYIFVPKNIGFYCCEYRISGKKVIHNELTYFELNGKSDEKDIIQCFDSEEKVCYIQLFIEIINIFTKSKAEENDVKYNLLKYKKYSSDINELYNKIDINNINEINNINDINNTLLDMNKYIGKILTKEDIEGALVNDYKIQILREKKIDSLCTKIINSTMTNIEYYNTILELGSEIKNDIIYRVFNYPHEFVKIEELNKITEDSPDFVKLAIFTYLNNLGVTTCIPKNKKKNPLITSTMLQLISCIDIQREIITLKFKIDKKSEYLILNDEKEKEKFISKKTHILSKILKCQLNDIILTNIRKGCLKADLILLNFENERVSTSDLRRILSENGIEYEIRYSLIDGYYLIDDIFDSRGNKKCGWGINEKRGPPGYLKDYIPPIGYIGYGLNVKNRYDNENNDWLDWKNKEGEWYIAYHGTYGDEAFKGILNPIGIGLRPGKVQKYQLSENYNILSNNEYIRCGKGVYLTPKIEEAEGYSRSGIKIKGKNYYLVFMCRVNPKKVRIPINRKEYWIVSGGYERERSYIKPIDEVRPYRVLLKKIGWCSIF